MIETKTVFIQSTEISYIEHFRIAKEERLGQELVTRELTKVIDPFENPIKTMECPPPLQKYTYTPKAHRTLGILHFS